MTIDIRYEGEIRTLNNVENTHRKYPDQEGAIETSILIVEYLDPQLDNAEYEGAIIEGAELTDKELDALTCEVLD